MDKKPKTKKINGKMYTLLEIHGKNQEDSAKRHVKWIRSKGEGTRAVAIEENGQLVVYARHKGRRVPPLRGKKKHGKDFEEERMLQTFFDL